MTHRAAPALIGTLCSILFLGAAFGFFYAWICSTMWGLDAADPRVAIAAMQAMNASVRNPVFLPVFFGTPLIALTSAGLAWLVERRAAAWALAAAGVLYGLGAMVFTTAMNVPLHDALAAVEVPADVEAARAIWTQYSSAWQWRNVVRTVVSGLALALGGLAALLLREPGKVGDTHPGNRRQDRAS